MTTGRAPRFPSSDFADRPRTSPGRAEDDEVVLDPFIDAPPSDPRAPMNVDLAARIASLEAALPSAERNARWVRLGVRVMSGLLGLGTAVLVYALALSRSAGDAAGEKRARDIERARYIGIIDQLVRDVARHEGTITSLTEALRTCYPIGALPILGPPLEPQDHP